MMKRTQIEQDYQNTLRETLRFDGVGVHSGRPVSMALHPADPGTGVVFSRVDLVGSPDIKGDVSGVTATALCTVLGDPSGAHVVTIEHLMAALRAMEIDNVLVELDAPEVPVMDGSSAAFVEAIEMTGLRRQSAVRSSIRVLKPVRVEHGTSWGVLTPHDRARFEIEIDFQEAAIGRQMYATDLTPVTFANGFCRARTFGFMKDVERLWAAGFALGSSLENSVVIGDDGAVINPEGLRYVDEFVRHKTLDAVGDLALAGAPLLATYRSYRGGHGLNAMMLQALFADPTAWEWTHEPHATGRGVADRAAGLGMSVAASAAYGPSKI